MITIAWFRKEKRTDDDDGTMNSGNTFVSEKGDVLLQAILGNGNITRREALNIPSVQSCINFIADTVSMLPIKLYKEQDGKAEEERGDNRVRLLNDDTGDTLDAVQFWRAMVADYYLGKGGYAYIRKARNEFRSIHYVDEGLVAINANTDPIHKDYNILVNGTTYKPFDFVKLFRNSKNGAYGRSIIQDNPLILSVAYNSLVYEDEIVKRGGNKRGFLKSQKRIDKVAIEALKSAWARMYSNGSKENVVVLNDGIEFQEASNSSVDLQLNQNKETNAAEICKLFNIPVNIIKGTASAAEYANAFKMGVMPVLRAIECALNRDFLLEKEKQSFYFAFDTRELMKGDIKTRYEAYKMGLDANFLQIDEVRYQEDLPALGLNWIKLGLDSVLYDPETKTIYTPNTNKISGMQETESSEAGKEVDKTEGEEVEVKEDED